MNRRNLVIPFLVALCAVLADFADARLPPDPDADEGKEVFQKLLGQRSLFVKFYAEWCGHCKKLAPTWARLTQIFKGDYVQVKILKMDAQAEGELAHKYGVKGFPTLLFFPAGFDGKTEPEVYHGSRNLDDLIEFVNTKTGLMRTADGSVKGRVKEADHIIEEVGCSDVDLRECADRMKQHLEAKGLVWKFAQPSQWNQRYINYYVHLLRDMSKAAKDQEWIQNELKRLDSLIEKRQDQVTFLDADFFIGRRRVLEHVGGVITKALTTKLRAAEEQQKEEAAAGKEEKERKDEL